jgi:hypothetical protein
VAISPATGLLFATSQDTCSVSWFDANLGLTAAAATARATPLLPSGGAGGGAGASSGASSSGVLVAFSPCDYGADDDDGAMSDLRGIAFDDNGVLYLAHEQVRSAIRSAVVAA